LRVNQRRRHLFRRSVLAETSVRNSYAASTAKTSKVNGIGLGTPSKALPFRAAADGETIGGKFTGTVQLSSGKFAVIEKSHEFTLVPWRPVINRQLGREVAGVVQGGSVSWQLGRRREVGL
jgi:hypothetical protein